MVSGARVKDLRIQQRMTLKELARKTGLTTSFLSQLERDLASPSVSSLEKIAQALNVKAAIFFEAEEKKELVFIKKDLGKKFLDKEKHIFSETLASGFLNIKMQPLIFTLGVGAELTRELIYSAIEKFGMVLKGRVEFYYDEEKMIFEEGDSIYCAHTQKFQKVKNIGDTEAKLLWVVLTLGL